MAQRGEREGKEGSLISGLLPLLCVYVPFPSLLPAEEAECRNMSRGKEGREREAKANKYANAQRRRSRYERSASVLRTTQLRDRDARAAAEQKT